MIGRTFKIIIVENKDEQSRETKACQAKLGAFESSDYECLVLLTQLCVFLQYNPYSVYRQI